MSSRDRAATPRKARGAKLVIGFGALLLVLAVSGVLNVDRGISIEKDDAIAIARARIDFEPERTSVRLVRKGFRSTPFWAVSFSIPATGGGFERLTTVLVDARSGEIAEVNTSATVEG